jgi:hypothetical protein
MGFSGGGTSPVTAHKHTNASGQGGALEKLVTLVDSDTLEVYRKMELLDEHNATGVEATYSFSPVGGLDLLTDYSEVIMLVSGSATAILEMQLVINDLITNQNYISQVRSDATVLSTALTSATTHVSLISSTIMAGASSFSLTIRIFVNPTSTSFVGNSLSHVVGEGSEITQFYIAHTDNVVDKLTIKTSTSTWATGTQIVTYGVRR